MINMPNETTTPFQNNKRDPRDEHLVERVLGSEVAREMGELVDGNELSNEQVSDLELSESERADTNQAEREVSPAKRREQYYEWGRINAITKEQIDENYVFNKDGTVICKGTIMISGTRGEDHILPPGLIEVQGSLYLSNNAIESFERFPRKVGGCLNLEGNNLSTLEGFPESVGDFIDLSSNSLTSLKGLPESVNAYLSLKYNKGLHSLEGLPKSIKGNLMLIGIPATTIPEGLNINGSVSLTRDQEELIEDCKAKGYRVSVS